MANLPKFEKSSGNVFADLGLPNPEELLLKSQISVEIERLMKREKLTQAKAAALMHVKQPDLSNLVRGKFIGFSVERLMLMLTKLGRDIELVVRPTVKRKGGIAVGKELMRQSRSRHLGDFNK